MSKRAFFFFLVGLAALSFWPVAAQDESGRAADYVPADFAGFVEVRLDDPALTLQGLNIAAFSASRLQPERVVLGANRLTFDNFIAFGTLFDVENTSFINSILPWVEGEMVIAYRDFDGQLHAEAADVLLILPTSSVLNAAGHLSSIIKQQDLLTPQTYRGIDVYEGDKTSIALTAPAVFIGPTDLIHAALDIQAGVAEPITASPVYTALRAAADADGVVFGYVNGDHLLPAVSGLVGGDAQTQPLLAAFGGALAQIRGESSFETLLLDSGFDGAAASLDFVVEATQITVTAQAVFHSTAAVEPAAVAEFDMALLELIPRNALLVHNGADAGGFVYDGATALPMSNFARQLLGGLLIQTLGTESELVTVPDAAQVQSAVENYIGILDELGGVDLQSDLIDHLSGSYMLALLPRPNNPAPVINTPFDLLVAARVADDGALDGVLRLLQNLFGLERLDDQTLDEWTFARLGLGDEPVFSMGILDGTLLIGTGEATARALDAGRGDNRLIDQPAWQTLSATAVPSLYVDRAIFFNTFFPASGGAVATADNRAQFGLYSAYAGDAIYRLQLAAVFPTGG